VREAAHVDDDEAGRAACATLTTLPDEYRRLLRD
jgi:hypothetical protein